ncbi:MAG TPA: hypothetical protein VFJ84_02285 [Candidatus Saccharimonadales bacterium]|nr:hypothetical protein [Candidatus Saccharimonadales bacterium]
MGSPGTPDPEALLGIHSAQEAPAEICMVAEDVLTGLEIVVRALKETAPQAAQAPEMMEHERRLKSAGEYLISYFEDLYRIECVPYIDFGLQEPKELEVDRLGILPDGDYALYDSQAKLSPGLRLPINYGGYHTVPAYNLARDSLPGSQNPQQLYIGYAPSRLDDMSGYAVSWNYLRRLFGRGQAAIGAVPKTELNQLDLAGVSEEALRGFVRR